MTDELKTLRALRDEAVDYGTIDCCDNWDSSKFYHAAYDALGEEGCITRGTKNDNAVIIGLNAVIIRLIKENARLQDKVSSLKTQHEALVAERDTLQNKVYDLEHVIQHWETDSEGWKDFLEQLEELAESWDEDFISANGYLFAIELRDLIKQHRGTP